MGMAEVQDMISLLFSRSLPKHVLAMQVPKRSLGNMNEHWPPKNRVAISFMFYVLSESMRPGGIFFKIFFIFPEC